MTIYIFGSNGMLGTYIKKQFTDSICFTRKDLDISNCDYKSIKEILKNLKEEDIVINAAGVIPHSKKSDFWKVNCDFPILLGNLCRVKNARLIHISTDCVFSGNKGNYTELDYPDSKTEYGMSKSLGENTYGTIITTSIIGEEINNKYSLLEWVKSNKNKSVNGFNNHLWNGMTCWQLSKIIREIIEKKIFWLGKRHFFSPFPITKCNLIKIISDKFNLNVDVKEINDEQTKIMTLSSIYENMFEIPTIEEQIEELTKLDLNFEEVF